MLWGRLMQILGAGQQDIEVARRTGGFSSEEVLASVSWPGSGMPWAHRTDLLINKFPLGGSLWRQSSACRGHPCCPCWSCPRLTGGTTLVQTHVEKLRVRPTSFRGGELLSFTSRPVTSPIDHHHLQLVVTVGEQAGHHAPGTVTREAGLLSLLRHPQVLQQTAFPPVVSL